MKSEEAAATVQASLQREIEQLQSQLDDTKSALKTVSDELNHIKYVYFYCQTDLDRSIETDHDKKYQEVELKYQAQLKETSDTYTRLTASQQQLEAAKKKFEGMPIFSTKLTRSEEQSRVNELTIQLQTQTKTFEATKISLEEQLALSDKRLEDSKAENEILHSQLESLGSLYKTSGGEPDTSLESISTSLLDESNIKDKAIEGLYWKDSLCLVSELREVISYVRREREIVQRRIDVASAEVLRWKQQAEHALRTRDEIQDTLQREIRKQHEQVSEANDSVFTPLVRSRGGERKTCSRIVWAI